MTHTEEALYARAEAELLHFLSNCMKRPTVKLSESLKSGQFIDGLESFLSDCNQEGVAAALFHLKDFSSSLKEKAVEEIRILLEVEYNHLFVGPGKVLAPPYESVFRKDQGEFNQGLVKGTAEIEVIAFYKKFHYVMPAYFVELPDHICIELEFLANLSTLEANAIDKNDMEELNRIHNGQTEFRNKHLNIWFTDFSRAVSSSAALPFYPCVLQMIKDLAL